MGSLLYQPEYSLKGMRRKNWDFLILAIWCPNPVERTSPSGWNTEMLL